MKKNVSIQMTWKCDIGCKHCCQDSKQEYLTPLELRRIIGGVRKSKETNLIHLTGGEPFFDFDALVFAAQAVHENGLEFAVITNAKWCTSEELAFERISILKNYNLTSATISYDAFHAKFVPIENIIHFVNAANSLGLPITIYASYSSDSIEETDHVLSKLTDLPVNIEKRWAIPVGVGFLNSLNTKEYDYSDIGGYCPIPNLLTVFPTGECYPCCSAGTHQDLTVGNIRDAGVAKIIRNRKKDPYMRILIDEGPKGIVERLPDNLKNAIKGRRYASTCHLCHEVLRTCNARELVTKQSIEEFDLVSYIIG